MSQSAKPKRNAQALPKSVHPRKLIRRNNVAKANTPSLAKLRLTTKKGLNNLSEFAASKSGAMHVISCGRKKASITKKYRTSKEATLSAPDGSCPQ